MIGWLFVAALAFAAPAIFLLGRLPSRWAGVAPARVLAVALLALVGVNGATVWGRTGADASFWFASYNAAFVATVVAGLAGFELARRLAGRPWRRWATVTVAVSVVVAWLMGTWFSLVAVPAAPWAVFAAGTLWSAASIVVSAALLLPVTKTWGRSDRRWLVLVLGATGALAAASLWNELAGPHLPLSPLWLSLGALAVYREAFRHLSFPPAESAWSLWCRRMSLSPREVEVLVALLESGDRTAVAERLFISPVTVKNHLAALYRRTNTSDLAALLAMARAQGAPTTDQHP